MTDFYKWVRQYIEEIDDLIFNRLTTRYLYLLSLIYLFTVYRVGLIPFPGPFLVSQNPFFNNLSHTPDSHFNYDSIVAPFIAYFTGLNSSLLTYSLLNFTIIMVANVGFVYLSKRIWNQDFAKFLTLLFVLNPLSTILLTWIGSYDSVSYFIQVFLFLTSNPILIIILGFLGGANHFPIILFSGLGLFLFRAYNPDDRIDTMRILSLLLGLGLGYITLKFYQNYYGLGLTLDRLNFLHKVIIERGGLKSHIGLNLFINWSTMLFSFYNVLWAIFVVLAYYLKRDYKKLFYLFLGSNICFFCLTLLIFDTTRVFCLLSWPMLFYGFLFLARRMQLQSHNAYLSLRRYFVVVTLIGLFVPRLYVWEGRIMFTGWISSFVHSP